MMLQEVDKVDLITQDDANGYMELVLVIESNELVLSNSAKLLQEKLNAYLVYALDGQLQEEYPNAKSMKAKIVIHSVAPLSEQLCELLERAKSRIEEEGVLLEYAPLGTVH
ncbi:MAG: hypothetical protein QM784_10500 [Polyangiaceae bacterium]